MDDFLGDIKRNINEFHKALLLAVSLAGLSEDEAAIFLLHVIGDPEADVAPMEIYELACYLNRPPFWIRETLVIAIRKIKRLDFIPESYLPDEPSPQFFDE